MIKPPSQQEIKLLDEAKKIILINGFLTVLICTAFVFAIYFTFDELLDKKLSNISSGDNSTQYAEYEKGINYNLGEFVVNLADGTNRYLKTDITLEFTRLHKERATDTKKAEDNLVHQLKEYEASMKDIVITVLSSKNASTLGTKEGKELVKEQIAQSIDTVLDGKREVLRVNFSQFVIQ